MSEHWHEVAAHGRHRIVAFDPDPDPDASAHYAVTTAEGAVLRRDLSLPEARIWLEHFTKQDARRDSPARAWRRTR